MVGKWNKSVILSYIGLLFGVLGITLAIRRFDIKYALLCLIVCGICDLFDGTVARKCKRTAEEKAFGIELDALIDVFNFIALPLVILISLGLNTKYHLVIYGLYAIFAVARLGYFNINLENDNKPVKYYEGLPLTYAAFFFPVVYLLSYFIESDIFNIIYTITTCVIGLLYIIKVKVPKPGKVLSIIFLLLAIIIIPLYLFIV
jgi:CDP-diacylglycerol--serine O-phosphatidyltransferase